MRVIITVSNLHKQCARARARARAHTHTHTRIMIMKINAWQMKYLIIY